LEGDFPIIAVGHSHGGNIIAWASTRLNKPLRAAVYLNSPFIQARQTVGPNVRAMSAVYSVLAIAFGIIPVYGITVADAGSTVYTVSVFGFLAAMIAAMIVAWRISNGLPKTMRRLDDVSTPARSVNDELSVFSTGDEVGALFATTFASRRILRFISKICGVVSLVGLVSTWIIAFIYGMPGADDEMALPQNVAIWIVILGGFGMFLTASMVFFMNVLSYGVEQGLLGMDGDIIGTPAPRNEVSIYTVPWPTEVDGKPTEVKKKRTSTHSSVYDDPQVINHVSKWLNTRLTR
jgi:hypothetical protein